MKRCDICLNRGRYDDSLGNTRFCSCEVGQSLPRTPSDPEVARRLHENQQRIDDLALVAPRLSGVTLTVHEENERLRSELDTMRAALGEAVLLARGVLLTLRGLAGEDLLLRLEELRRLSETT